MFVGITYDPLNQKVYAFLNNQYTELTEYQTDQNQIDPGKSLSFGGNAHFLIDNVLYFPKFSTAEEISAIYKMSKLTFCFDILLTFSTYSGE